MSAATIGKGGRGRIARNADVLAQQCALALDGDMPHALLVDRDIDRRTEAFQHVFGVIAGRDRFDHSGDARRIEPGQQHRGLDLGGRHRHPIAYRIGGVRPVQADRQPVAVLRLHLNAHLAQRIKDAAHRALHQRGVPGETGFHVVDAGKPHDEAHAGAGIAEIQHALGFEQAAIADTLDNPVAGPACGYSRQRHASPRPSRGCPRLRAIPICASRRRRARQA
jgi:hypothetical protein